MSARHARASPPPLGAAAKPSRRSRAPRVWSTAILIFDDVEVLDFAGPFEVFSVTGRRQNLEPFHVFTVAEHLRPVNARNGLSINPRHSFADCPPSDILLVPGGYGTRREMKNPVMLEWVAQRARQAELALSVCSGALLLAAAGLLDGLAATTHHMALEELRLIATRTDIRADQRIVDNGHIVLSAGISAGLDMSLYIVSRLLGREQAEETAVYMEYDWRK